MKRLTVLLIVILFVFSGLLPCLAQAETAALKEVSYPATGSQRMVLTVITAEGTRGYTLDQIEALGLREISTETYWPDDKGNYQGVLLRDFLRHAGLHQEAAIALVALDDYTTNIPRKDWETWDVLLATRKEGKPISVRRKGPTRIIYPLYLGGEVARSEMRIRWIWAIKEITPRK